MHIYEIITNTTPNNCAFLEAVEKKAVFMRKNSLQEHYCFNRPQAWQVWRALDGRKEVNLCRLRSLRDSRSGIRHDFVIETWGNNLKIMNLSG